MSFEIILHFYKIADNCVLNFLQLWENIISVKANLSIVGTLPFYAQLDKFESLLLNQNLSCIVYNQMLCLFNEALCYGSTLELQDMLPEETCNLAHQIVRHVKDFRLLELLPRRQPENFVGLIGYKRSPVVYADNLLQHDHSIPSDSSSNSGDNGVGGSGKGGGGGDGCTVIEMDKTISQKMVLLVLKSIAVTVKEIRSDSSDSSIDSTDYDAFQDMVLIERSIRNVLCKLETFIKVFSLRCQTSFASSTGVTLKRDWHDYGAVSREGSGEQGAAVNITALKLEYKEYGYDAMLSDYISVNQSVPDTRPEECKNFKYLAKLPMTSMIIVFFNERFSVLLRTLHGIINRSPKELLREIILVDDCSSNVDLHGPLDDYLRYHMPMVRLIRLQKRSGLMIAHMTGARAASKETEVLIFMYAHFEVNYNWLPPLLEPIALNPKACTSPSFDSISFKDLKYEISILPFRGFFDWKLQYHRIALKSRELMEPAKNIKEYILIGSAIAIGADFFWKLGGFDEGMEYWGGEQFELSFKLWMCGGEIIQVPCSRMAHLFRDFNSDVNVHQYVNGSFLNRNFRRVIDVWMDETHRQYVFDHRYGIKNVHPGDLTERIAIRDRLKCKSFTWMMENIMPEVKQIFPPIEPKHLAEGLLHSMLDPKLCLALKDEGKVVLKSCDDSSDENMYWIYSFRGQISTESHESCLQSDSEASSIVHAYSCDQFEKSQKWYYDRKNQWIAQVEHNKCLMANGENENAKLAKCDLNNSSMKWNFSETNEKEMDRWDLKLKWSSFSIY